MKRIFEPGDIVKHFKRETIHYSGDLIYYYKIIGEGYFTETNERVMIYQALYGERTLYVRPYDMFISEVEHDKYPRIKQKYRFEKVNKEELSKLWEVSASFGESLIKGS